MLKLPEVGYEGTPERMDFYRLLWQYSYGHCAAFDIRVLSSFLTSPALSFPFVRAMNLSMFTRDRGSRNS